MRQNRPKIIGLTGGIATGKSTVSRILIGKGYALIDSDKISRELVQVGKAAYNEIIQEFGTSILNDDKSINRGALGKLIFNSSQARMDLNAILHPHIVGETLVKIEKLSKSNKIIFLDIPLLFEVYGLFADHGISFDEIWLVYTDRDTQVKRLMERDGIAREEALKKIESQMDIEEKRPRSSRIIDNRGNLQSLGLQVDRALNELIQGSEG
ncbi:MAG: dephospho-CoA kinase [Tissierellaceae bacterium]